MGGHVASIKAQINQTADPLVEICFLKTLQEKFWLMKAMLRDTFTPAPHFPYYIYFVYE